MLRITNIKMPVKHNINDLKAVVYKLYKILKSEILSFEIAGQAIDARNKNNVIYVYSVDVELVNEKKYEGIKNVREIEKKIYKIEVLENIKTENRPVVVGTGPSGVFAGLILAEAGWKPIIIEQGKSVDEREKEVYDFFRTEI